VEAYHGEISDVQFYNVVKKTIQSRISSEKDDDSVEDYGQDEAEHRGLTVAPPLEPPSKETLDERIALYFSTIHIAYPFIQQDSFMERYARLRDGTGSEPMELTWLGLLRKQCITRCVRSLTGQT
jgi:hypothetical protein